MVSRCGASVYRLDLCEDVAALPRAGEARAVLQVTPRAAALTQRRASEAARLAGERLAFERRIGAWLHDTAAAMHQPVAACRVQCGHAPALGEPRAWGDAVVEPGHWPSAAERRQALVDKLVAHARRKAPPGATGVWLSAAKAAIRGAQLGAAVGALVSGALLATLGVAGAVASPAIGSAAVLGALVGGGRRAVRAVGQAQHQQRLAAHARASHVFLRTIAGHFDQLSADERATLCGLQQQAEALGLGRDLVDDLVDYVLCQPSEAALAA